MNIDLHLRETLRFFLLPISFEKEEECIDKLKEIFSTSTIDSSSYSEFLRNKYDDWKNNIKDLADPKLTFIIQEILKVANPTDGNLFAKTYFVIHKTLRKNPFISFELSTIVLSHLRLIVLLARNEKMSSAKISKVLNSVDARLSDISWREVQTILRILKLKPTIDEDKAKYLYKIDEELEGVYFADADMKDASYIVGEIAKNLRFEYNLESLLNKLSQKEGLHIPYLQILHYQCIIPGFYDHVLSVPYEFAPRGNLASWFFSHWDKLLSTSNPVLNNAKGVDVLDKNWSRSKKKNHFPNASVLVEILHGMDGMGYSASQELASYIRQWLIRYIRINSVEIIPVATDLNNHSILSLLNSICSEPTASFGILEQRLVDLVSQELHINPIWRARGLKDSVNANNLSKRKLGDTDFQNSSSKEIYAYEAHGGKLNRVYFEGHLKTFVRSYESRKTELESIAEIDEWEITVVFVAYSFEENLESSFIVGGKAITIEFKTFNEFLNLINTDSESFMKNFKSLFLDVVNNRRTPQVAREKIQSLLENPV